MVPPILRVLTRLDSVGQVDLIAPLPRWLTSTTDDPDSAPGQPFTDPAANDCFPPLAQESSIYVGFSYGFLSDALYLKVRYFQCYRRCKIAFTKEI